MKACSEKCPPTFCPDQGGRPVIYVMIMFVVGGMTAMQPAINAALSRTVGVLESSLVNFAVGSAFLGLIVLLFGQGNIRLVATTPPWQWIGGLLGACLVLGGIVSVPRIGASAAILSMVFGNLIIAAAIDHFGLFNLPVTPVDWKRLLGFALMMAGLLLVVRR